MQEDGEYGTSMVLLRYQYQSRDEKSTSRDKPSWEWKRNTLDEHLKVLQEHGSVLWGVFDEKTERSTNRSPKEEIGSLKKRLYEELAFAISRDNGVQVLLLTRGPNWANILFRANIKNILDWESDIAHQMDNLKIPFYYRERRVPYYLEITHFERISFAYLDLYSTEKLWTVRRALTGQSSILFLQRNKEIAILESGKYDYPASGIAEITKIHAIRIHNYSGIRSLTLSISSEVTWEWSGKKNDMWNHWNRAAVKKYNLFAQDGLANVVCILWKNGVGKSRIIKLLLSYIAWWQDLRQKEIEGEFEILLEDRFGRMVTTTSNQWYMGEVIQWALQNSRVALDFSFMGNVFISNVASDPFALPSNTLMDSTDVLERSAGVYQYLWVMPSGRYVQSSAIGSMNVMLFLVLFDQELAEIFREILEKVIGRSFVSIRMDTLAALDIPKSEREKENLRDLISWVASWEIADYFFERNSNRRKLKEIFQLNPVGNGTQLTGYLLPEEGRTGKRIRVNIRQLSIDLGIGKEFFQNVPLWKQTKKNIFGKDGIHSLQKEPNGTLGFFREIFRLLFSSNLLSLEVFDENWRGLQDMSTGERSIVMTLVKILYAIMENEDRHLFFYLDEPDIFLHPEWQRRFIDALTTLTSNKAIQKRLSSLWEDSRKSLSILMTSHSPIIISDIPRENLIVLEKKGVGGTDRIEQVTLKTESFLNNLLANYAVTFSVESFVWEYAAKKFKAHQDDKEFQKIIGDELLAHITKEMRWEN